MIKHFGLIGKNLEHSFSANFFKILFDKNNINATYSNFSLDSIEEVDQLFELHNFSGINVTIPYKQEIIPFLDNLSDEALEIGAVNVIQFKEGKKIGHNTDAFGFHQSIKPFLTNMHERALIIGTGGASKAVEFVFKSLGIDVIFISRNPSEENHFSYDEINNHMLNACKVIVNCTPVGTFPNNENVIDFPYHYLTNEHLVVDLIYNPIKTKFLQKSQEFGATILNGESMLHQQALKAWEIWNS
jgi:shikimate dehydrogenase